MFPVKLGAPTNWRSACASYGETPRLMYPNENRRMSFIALGTKLLRARRACASPALVNFGGEEDARPLCPR